MKCKYIISVILLLALMIAINCAQLQTDNPQKKPLANRFAQSYSFIDSVLKSYTVGLWYYDWNIKAMIRTYQNSYSEAICNSILPAQTWCNQLIVNNTLYVYYPQRRQCCKCNQNQIIINPNSFTHLTYNSTVQIQGIQYFKWNFPQSQNQIYTTTDQRQVLRRVIQSRSRTDYSVYSYIQNFDNPHIFDLPDYCQSSKTCQSDFCQQKRVKVQTS